MENEMNDAAGIIIRHNDKVLMCKRGPKSSLPGIWSIPCGGMEKGEDPAETAIREFAEETDWDMSSATMKFVGGVPIQGGKGTIHCFLVDSDFELMPDLGNAKDGFEHTECGYFSKDEIPKTTDVMKNFISNVVL